MSIIETTSYVLTEGQQLTEAVNTNKELDAGSFETLKQGLARSMAFVWHNPNFTAQQVFDEYQRQNAGDAAHLFAVAAKTIELLALIDPTYVPPQPLSTYSINADSSVTTPVV